MALTKSNVFFTSLMVLVALFGVALGGTVHKVGDSNGWTVMGENYASWASSRTFQAGDSLVFEYNNEFHDVNEVTLENFEHCEPSNPLARYQTGSDTVTLTKPGVYNYICGIPGHCDIGQKLQILVLPTSLGPVAAPVSGPVRSPSSSLSPSPSRLGPVAAPVSGPVPSPISSLSPSPSPLGSVAAPVSGPVRSPSSSLSPSPSPFGYVAAPVSGPVRSPSSLGPVAASVSGPVRSPSSSLSPSPPPLAYSPVNNAPHYQMGPAPTPHSAAPDSKSVWIGISFLLLLSLFILV